ncbi:MAG: DUF1993 domain-containing protein [Comamonadaceae bacterium]|jgi:hypothetical protein|nr:DUF1993 domain-containing protein [Comamonadaceae bacterium]
MTQISMHAASAPVFARMLDNMLNWLDAARAHAEARKFSPDAYLALRLAPDMLPFTKQIQIASDAAKACVARLAGQDIPRYEDNEATLDELAQRIRKTRDYVLSVPAQAFEGSEDREISVPRRSGEPLRFDGLSYLRHYATPNFYFHATTAYALLRQAGVPLGKADYLG